jgi:hypothetical protein
MTAPILQKTLYSRRFLFSFLIYCWFYHTFTLKSSVRCIQTAWRHLLVLLSTRYHRVARCGLPTTTFLPLRSPLSLAIWHHLSASCRWIGVTFFLWDRTSKTCQYSRHGIFSIPPLAVNCRCWPCYYSATFCLAGWRCCLSDSCFWNLVYLVL